MSELEVRPRCTACGAKLPREKKSRAKSAEVKRVETLQRKRKRLEGALETVLTELIELGEEI